MRARNIDGTKHAISHFGNVRSFLNADCVPNGYSVIYESGIPIDVLCQNGGYGTTLVFLHGAIDTSYTLPITSGLSVSRDVEVNRVFLTDSSLNLAENLTLGWFAGNSKQRLQPLMTKIIAKILSDFSSENVIFFGTSGGGFASLYFAAQFDGSTAVVVNPQTNIEKYERPAVDLYAKSCFGIDAGKSADELPSDIDLDLTGSSELRV